MAQQHYTVLCSKISHNFVFQQFETQFSKLLVQLHNGPLFFKATPMQYDDLTMVVSSEILGPAYNCPLQLPLAFCFNEGHCKCA